MSDLRIANMNSICILPFKSWNGSFDEQKFYILIDSNFTFFPLGLAFFFFFTKSLRRYSPPSHSKSLIASPITLKSTSHLELNVIWYNVRIKINIFIWIYNWLTTIHRESSSTCNCYVASALNQLFFFCFTGPFA